MREHSELLSSVRDDISEYKVGIIWTLKTAVCSHVFVSQNWGLFSVYLKASGSMSPRVQLLRERAAIHGSISHVRLACFLLAISMSDSLD